MDWKNPLISKCASRDLGMANEIFADSQRQLLMLLCDCTGSEYQTPRIEEARGQV
jgi:hypothetical protein